MADQRLADQHREQALWRLAEIESELVAAANWLSGLDLDSAAIPLECASRDVAAAAWRLEGPRRVTRSPRPGP